MSIDDLVREAQGLPENLIENLVNYAQFLKYNQVHGVKKQRDKDGKFRSAGILKGKIFIADDFDEPLEDFNDVTIAAMNEFYDMKENPENYKRYSSFRDAVRDVLDA